MCFHTDIRIVGTRLTEDGELAAIIVAQQAAAGTLDEYAPLIVDFVGDEDGSTYTGTSA